jgi:signal transduction histidine kinase/CheY-like chemotaxis protein/AraC-like DNA-binding protein
LHFSFTKHFYKKRQQFSRFFLNFATRYFLTTIISTFFNEDIFKMKTIHKTNDRHSLSWLANAVTTLVLTAAVSLCLASCAGEKAHKRFVVGVSQCSEDTWRDKLNEELRIAATYYDVALQIKSANDDVRLQTEQIDRFVEQGVDLLVVAPGQVSISPAIDKAYEKGIPVIIFDRRTRSNKYTAYIGADNHDIGASMAEFMANANTAGTKVVELCGLSSSSPAIERDAGFDSVAAHRPNIDIVKKVYADWTEEGAYHVMDSLLSTPYPAFNCLFAHNDRMAMGARRAVVKHGIDPKTIKLCGIDAMPQHGGGMQLVAEGKLFASSIYPTRGDEVMRLAMKILTHKPYDRENRLSSALVTEANARVLLMQYDETTRQQGHLSELRDRVDKTVSDFKTQRIYLLIMLGALLLLGMAYVYVVRANRAKARLNRQLADSVEQQRQMTKHIEELTHTQLQFFTNISHELRTPLTLIAGPTEQLLEDKTVQGTHRRMLQMVERNTKILIQLVSEILDFRKVQNNKAVLKLNRFNLAETLRLWADDFDAVTSRKGITVKVDAPADAAQATVIADRDKLARVFFNLMSNAVKYTPKDGTITITLRHNEGSFFFTMNNDSVKTISKDDLPHIFERFYQPKGSIGGTGIGLALVKANVDLHHGSISATSSQEEGTTFSITLPDTQEGYDPDADNDGNKDNSTKAEQGYVDDSYAPVNVEAAEKAERITNAEDFDADRPLVLIIDDNNGMRAYLRSILQDHYNVSEAVNGQQGLERARREVPKLVVCDVMMPVMDGLEFTRRLKADTATSHIPVILLTARSLSEQREEGYGTGADSYLTKPFTGSLLLARIDNLIHSRTLLRSLFSGNSKEEEKEEEMLGAQDQTFVTRLREVIRDNMGDSDFSVERIGEEIGLSRVQLYRKVKALTGQTPVELLRKARLERSRRLIEKTEKSVSEIAYEVGFTSPSYFNKCFKDEFGISPGAMREKAQG